MSYCNSRRPMFDHLTLRQYIAAGFPKSNESIINFATTSDRALARYDQNKKKNTKRFYSDSWATTWKRRNLVQVVRLHATTIKHNSVYAPMVPPEYDLSNNVYKDLDSSRRTEITRSEQETRGLNNMNENHRSSGYSGKYIQTLVNEGNMTLVDTDIHKHGIIRVHLPNGTMTNIIFHCQGGEFHNDIVKLNELCRKVGFITNKLRLNNKVCDVRNNMVKYGTVTFGSGKTIEVPSHKAFSKFSKKGIEDLNKQAFELCVKLMPGSAFDILSNQPCDVPQLMGGKKGLCPIIFQSHNLENSAHYDTNDLSKCFAVFQNLPPIHQDRTKKAGF